MVAELAAEEQFGPYLVYERLGVGGMATVHRALERGIEGFERIVALKRLLPHLAEDASFIKSFVREAKLASLLNHNNIVQIFELGRVGTEYFISMEYIDGRDIRRVLRHARKVTGPPPINITTGLLLQLCDALDYAHSKVDDTGHPLGLVHRDVSPSNLLVTSAGHLKVIDFGIAKAQSSQLRTQTGRVKGKLAYMAPEAIMGGRELDARSDLFAAGVIAHELVTARPLFASKNEYQTLLKVQRGDIMSPSTFNQACPPELDAIVLRALARDPDDRFVDAGELRDRLLDMRRKYNLQTGHRDVAQWLDWAFSLEPPGDGFAIQSTFDQTSNVVSAGDVAIVSSRQPRREDDEVVEIAWGDGEAPPDIPVLLDDVPDVSEKHLVSTKIDVADDLADDIPASQPSHGIQPRVRATTNAPVSSPDPRRSARPTTPRELAAIAPPVIHEPVREPQLPSVRFRAPSIPPPDAPREPAIAHGIDLEAAEPATETRTALPDRLTIGAAIVARRNPTSRWVIAGAVFALGATAAVALYRSRDREVTESIAPPPPIASKTGTVKFVIEPADVTITIGDRQTHVGSPWSIQLEPGVHSVQIHRDGYKARLASIELSPNETTTMIVSLERLGTPGALEANLILSSKPSGLEVVIDSKPQAQRTPMKAPIAAGPHTIVLRQNGVDVWKHEFVAQANADHEFSPSMTEDKLRERKQHLAPPIGDPPPPRQDPPPRREPQVTSGSASTGSASTAPAIEPAPTPTPIPIPIPTIPTPPPLPVPIVPSIVPSGPVTVAPTAVTRISGEIPTFTKYRHLTDLPSTVAAKVCITTNGSVGSVAMLTRIDATLAAEIGATIRRWRYAPYKQNGSAVAACFVVSFRMN